ncbi:MAG: D-aminoacyl-tRNA deacylase [Bryobacteraceae bacterium]|nr:D-aminoacyl-tRNA deacylase [Bryobacteraceae bacterium]
MGEHMRAVVQRVREASVEVDGAVTGRIGRGLLVLLGVSRTDTEADAEYLVAKVADLRIFNDASGKMNLSLKETGGGMLVISQFTLYGDTRRGRRPSFDGAAPPERARHLYEYFLEQARKLGLSPESGVFQAHMHVSLTNEGPVTLICESKVIDRTVS